MPAALFLSSGNLIADRRYDFGRDLQLRGDLTAAADLMAQAIELEPGFASAWFALGDLREHRNPSLARLDAKTGSVPKVAKLTAQGGLLCQNDFSLRIKTEGSAKEACYRLHIEGLATPQVLTLKGTDDQTLSLSRGAYVSGRSLALRLEKICPGALALPFSVALHL